MKIAEISRKFEGDETTDDFTAYERLLNQMFEVDKNIQLKTELNNPLEFARFYFIIQMIKDEGKEMFCYTDVETGQEVGLLDDEADLLAGFGLNVMKNMISKDRKGRKEAFDSIKSYNIGSLNLDDQEQEKFKRIIKDMK
jgi:hypothetical protein